MSIEDSSDRASTSETIPSLQNHDHWARASADTLHPTFVRVFPSLVPLFWAHATCSMSQGPPDLSHLRFCIGARFAEYLLPSLLNGQQRGI